MADGMRIDMDSTGEFGRRLGALAKACRPAARDALNEIGIYQVRRVAERAHGRRLAKSMTITGATLARLEVRVGSALPWARITHTGGVIRPNANPSPEMIRRRVFGASRIGWLTIPLTFKGVPEYARARDYKGLFKFKAKSGNLFLAQPIGQFQATKSGKVRRKNGSDTGGMGRHGTAEASGGIVIQGKANKKGVSRGVRLLFMLVRQQVVQARPYMYWSYNETKMALDILTRHYEMAARGEWDRGSAGDWRNKV